MINKLTARPHDRPTSGLMNFLLVLRSGGLVVLVLISLMLPSYAGLGSSAGADFLNIGIGPRPIAMGEAFTGLADDSSALFYNPAGLAHLNFPEAYTMYNKWYADVNQQVAAFAVPTNLGVVGCAYQSLGSGDIQGYDANGAATSTFNTASSSLQLSFGRKLNPYLSMGGSIKSISERLESVSAGTYAIDAGLMYHVNPQFSLGLAALNLGPGITYIKETSPLPASYRLGAAYSARLFDDSFSVSSDLISYPDQSRVNLGFEYLMRNFFAVRAGVTGGALRGGIGIYANLFSFDYAYTGNADLGAAHQFSIGISLASPDKVKKLVMENLALGKAYLEQKKYADAALRFDKVLDLDKNNEEAQVLLNKSRAELEDAAFQQVFAEKTVEVKRSMDDILASGRNYMDQGKYLEALGEFNNALKLDPTNLTALKLQSDAQNKMETELIEKSREEAKGYLGEAMKQVITGNYDQALVQVNKALEKDPKNNQALELKKKLELILKIEKK